MTRSEALVVDLLVSLGYAILELFLSLLEALHLPSMLSGSFFLLRYFLQVAELPLHYFLLLDLSESFSVCLLEVLDLG